MTRKKKDPEHWTIGKWRELPQYCCKYCPFDTLDEAGIKEHYLKIHFSSQPVPPINVTSDPVKEIVN